MNTRIEGLRLFNGRVAKLERSGLAGRMRNSEYRLDLEEMVNGSWVPWDGITEDAVDAFVLNIRLLTQDQDGFSIRRLAEDVYSFEDVPHHLRDRFMELRTDWRAHLDQTTVIRDPKEDRNLSNGELFDVIVYGGLAHANADKVHRFEALTCSGAFSAFVGAKFLSTLRVFFEVVVGIRKVNQELLEIWKC